MSRGIVISLCDLTGVMAAPWLVGGYDVILVDPQHPEGVTFWSHYRCGHDHQRVNGRAMFCQTCVEAGVEKSQAIRANGSSTLTKVGHILNHPVTWRLLREAIVSGKVVAVFGFPVCTELAVSGTAHWASKREKNPHFQTQAMELVHECRVVGELSGAPYFFENPVSAISSIFDKPTYTFQPNEYGGYLPEDDVHPLYPEYFPPRDAYGKKTCLWAGNGFVMPPRKPVPLAEDQTEGQGQSKAHNMLGGKSERTKNIRSATPRGFAQAVYEANAPHLRQFEDLI
jgi:hypothetical protein